MKHIFVLTVALMSSLVLSATHLNAEPVKKKKKLPKEASTEVTPEALTAKSWVKRLREENKLKAAATGLFPVRILFVEDLPAKGNPVFADFDVKAFDQIGFLKAASKKDLDYFFALNKKTTNTQEKEAPAARTAESWLSILLDASEADSVLWMHKKGDWQLYHQIRDGKPQVLITRPGTEDSAEGVHKWLLNALGYEGVIIDKQNNFLLIGNLANITKKDTQALLLKNSADKFSMATAKKEGSGLLQLANHFEGFAMFELLLGDQPESIPVGTKIAIEKSQNKNAAKKTKNPAATNTPGDAAAKPTPEAKAKDATPEPSKGESKE